MAIQDGMRTHDDYEPRYRMPDLLTRHEMELYFAGTYGVGIQIVPLSDELRERANGVGTLPVPTQINTSDREIATLREKLGLAELEHRVDVQTDTAKELDSRVLSPNDFRDKYGVEESSEPPVQEKVEEDKESDSEEVTPEDRLLDMLNKN